jgi:hypothetical protein
MEASANDPEPAAIARRYFYRGDRRVGILLQMVPKHLRVIHLVHVIARQHDDVAWRLAGDRIQVLVHRIGRAQIPVLAHALLRRQDLDEFAKLFRDDVPPHADMAVK